MPDPAPRTTSGAPPDHAGVTVVVTRRVRPGHAAAHAAALSSLQQDARACPALRRLALTIAIEGVPMTGWLMRRPTRALAPRIDPRRRPAGAAD